MCSLGYWRILLFIYSYIDINYIIKCVFQRRRCCVFDSPGLPNDSAGYPGLRMVCGEQRRRCCAFFDSSAMKCFIVSVPSQKKLNTYGVESPCERLPGVGSFLANPRLSKEQLVPSCAMRAFILRNSSIGIMAQYQRSCEMKQLWAWRGW